jgi:hypothetical protein
MYTVHRASGSRRRRVPVPVSMLLQPLPRDPSPGIARKGTATGAPAAPATGVPKSRERDTAPEVPVAIPITRKEHSARRAGRTRRRECRIHMEAGL